MTQHARIPAIAAIVLTALAGLGLFAATGQFRRTDLAHAPVEELEKRAAGSTDGRVWLAYGDKLREMDQFASSVKAYQRALELQPDLTDARLRQVLSLGQSDANAFFDYVAKLSMSYPKVAVDLMDRPELRALHGDPRWEPAASGAQAQAVD